MFSWLLVNVVLSVLALLFIALNAAAPHRLRFLVCFVALLAWLLPWQLVPEFLPQWHALGLWQIERELTMNTAEYMVRPIVIMSTGLPVAGNFLAFTLAQLGFIALCASGFLLFCWHVWRHQMHLSHLQRTGQDGAAVLQTRGLISPVPVIIQSQIAGAFSSGLLKPRIWIHSGLTTSTQLATLLRHELTHIRQHDNWYLLLITLVEKLFWWNPLVWLLGRQARELQELSCDVLCQRASADYPLHLAELMLDNTRLNPTQGSLLLSANIFNRTNLNIKRIKLLQRSYPMKARHLISTIATAVCALATIGVVTAQPEEGSQQVIMHRQISQSAVSSAGNLVFITHDPSQPMTEEEAAAIATSHFVLHGTDSIAGMHTMSWNAEDHGTMDQYLKVDQNGDETAVSFNFTDTPLLMILEPLAHMVTHDSIPALGVAHVVAIGAPVTHQIFTRAEKNVNGSSTEEAQAVELHTASAQSGTEAWNAPVHGARAMHTAPFTAMTSSNLVIEDEADKERLVSVKAENVSIETALEIIGAEANCDIVLEDDEIVVSSCAN